MQRIARYILLLGKLVPRFIFGSALLDAPYENGKFWRGVELQGKTAQNVTPLILVPELMLPRLTTDV